MKVFISWSGERSLALAQALHSWLPLVLQYVDPWLSKSDIDAGQRWDDDLSKRLSECNFGISCITRDNVNAPWLLFEAGALAKSVDNSKLVPLLLDLDLKDFAGPLSRFQAKKVEKEGVSDILSSINKDAAVPVPENRLVDLIDMAWDKLQGMVDAIPGTTSPATKSRTQSDILEELVSSVRTVEARVRDFSDDDGRSRSRRRPRIHPGMLMEVVHHTIEEPDDPSQILILASLLREDFPWVYEFGSLAYQAIKNGEISGSRRSLKAFQRSLEMVMRSGVGREAYDQDRYHLIMRMLDGNLIDRFAAKVRRPGKVITNAHSKSAEAED